MVKQLAFQVGEASFGAVGAWWSLLQGMELIHTEVVPWLRSPLVGLCLFVAVALATLFFSLFGLLWRIVRLKNSNRTLRVRVGDILKTRDSSILIGVNDALTCQRKQIGFHSIHRQLLNIDNEDRVETAFEDERKKPENANLIKFPYGYTFCTELHGDQAHYIFLVMSTIEEHQVIDTTPADLRIAINTFFANAKHLPVKNGGVTLPMIGAGSADVEMEEESIIKMIACAFITHKPKGCKQIRNLTVKVRLRDLKRINLARLERDLRWMAGNCCSFDT